VEKVLYEQITWSDAVKRVESAKSKIDEKIDRLIADGDNDEQHESYAKMSEAKVVIQEVLAVLKKRDEDQLDGLFAGPIEPFLEEFGETITQIRHAGIQVTSSITEITASTKQQKATANEHAATASEIAASTNQIAATSTNLMTTMKRVNSLTQNAAAAAEEGHTGLIHIDRTMVKMEEATGSIVGKLSILSEKAADIAGVVKTINKLADQTNLLSSFTIRCWTFDVRCSLCKFT